VEEKKQAKDLVNYVRNQLILHPPSLTTIIKARMAGLYFGLEKVILADTHQLLAEAVYFTHIVYIVQFQWWGSGGMQWLSYSGCRAS